MRVLHIHSGNLYGGVETLLLTLARERDLCPAMEPHFALCFEGRLSEELAAQRAPVHFLGNVRSSRPLSIWRSRSRVRELLRSIGFELVVCHSAWSQAIFGPVVRRLDSPLVFWLHDAANGRHWLERWARQTVPDLALCNSRFTESTLHKIYPGVSSRVFHYPVSLCQTRYSPGDRASMRATLNTPVDAAVIVQVSRMEAWKGHSLHLHALGRLASLPGWVCWVVGGAQRPQEVPYFQKLKKIAARLGISDRVRFVGQRSDVPRLLAAADLYCQPNTGPEPFGLSFIEALLARLPVVTTSIGGAREIVDRSCGILVRSADAVELADCLRQLILDASLRAKMAEAGPARARELCEPSTQMASLNEMLAHMVSQKTCEGQQ